MTYDPFGKKPFDPFEKKPFDPLGKKESPLDNIMKREEERKRAMGSMVLGSMYKQDEKKHETLYRGKRSELVDKIKDLEGERFRLTINPHSNPGLDAFERMRVGEELRSTQRELTWIDDRYDKDKKKRQDDIYKKIGKIPI